MATPLNAIVEEQSRRSIRSKPVPVITLNSVRGGRALAAGMPGSVHIVLARKESGAIERVRAALQSGEEELKKAIDHLLKPLRRRQPVTSVDAMAKLIIKQPVFAELRSSGERLHSGMFVPPGAEAITVTYPYNGGPVPARGLELVEYVADGAGDAALEAIALKCDPKLTKAEAAALRLLPKEQHAVSIGRGIDCDSTYAVIAAAAVLGFTAGAIAAVALLVAALPRVDDPHVADDVLKELGPGASARRLLELRRKALIKAAQQLAKRRQRDSSDGD